MYLDMGSNGGGLVTVTKWLEHSLELADLF